MKDKILIAALNQAYKPFLEKDYSPEAFLFLEMPLSEVDVNVHPAKIEVRFKDTNQIFRLVNRSIEHTVLKEMGIKDVYPEEPKEKKTFKVEEMGEPEVFKVPWEERISRFSWDVKIFEHQSQDSYRLIHETIPEIAFPMRRILTSLRDHFGKVEVLDPFGAKASDRSERLYFVCTAR